MKKRLLWLGALVLVAVFIIFAVRSSHPSVSQTTAKQQAQVSKQDKNLPSNRVFSLLPYYSPYFELQAQPSGKNTPNILFTYLPPPPGSNLPNSDEPTAINNALAWLTQQGISSPTYKVINTSNNQVIN